MTVRLSKRIVPQETMAGCPHYGISVCAKTMIITVLGGDTVLEKDYTEIILRNMEQDSTVVAASGDFPSHKQMMPHGAGRFVRQSFFFEHYTKYPEIVGYESEILFKAKINGYKTRVYSNAVSYHLDKLGHKHGFSEWGWAMRALGYHPLIVLYRVAGIILSNNADMSNKNALNILYQYMTYRPKKTGYLSMFPKDTRREIREMQSRKMLQYFKKRLTRRTVGTVTS